jgi:hypothetical protein
MADETPKSTISNMRLSSTLLLISLLACASLVEAQTHEGVMTVETSPTGSVQVRYFIDSTLCNFGFPLTTHTTKIPGGWQITTDLDVLNFCSTVPGPPATLLVDLGQVGQGRYTVTWSFNGGLGYGTRSTTFNVAAGQTAIAIPALSWPTLVMLTVLVVAASISVSKSVGARESNDA